ncbi:MORN repeat-containing protein [Algoriphagus formosus]|uniref:hypothetical protein n=1 Tax=Algoriphagus formosus TaxID=2007308 RepID=UPI000C2874D4|nr:hypothetical protein [Algoriphagus formosus]
MIKTFLIGLFIFAGFITAEAQCLEGDCKNGFGKMDLIYCIYEGTFVKGIPEGAGTMYYETYRYEGEVQKGLEHGFGRIIFEDGSYEEVEYYKGKKIESQYIKVEAQDYKSYQAKRDPRCVSGDCANGQGEYHFPSGNKYKGNFKDFQPYGNGEWDFANGDRYVGTVSNGQKEGNGTYHYSNGWRFTGSYQADAEYTGTYFAPNGQTVKVLNGTVQIPKPSVSYTITTGGSPQHPDHERCPMCDGKGTMMIPGRSRQIQGSPSYNVYRSTDGKVSREYAGSAPVYTVRGPDRESTCSICGGTGVVKW